MNNGRTWALSCLIALLLLGVFFRFANLDRQLYWGDEVFTSLHIAGRTVEGMERDLYDGRVVSVEDLHGYQYPHPGTRLADTVSALKLEYPQHVPLYFVSARLWTQAFGKSIAVTRGFSAFLAILTFPCLYWLCRELFDSPRVGLVAIALVAISPVHVVYAQEARPYILYIVAVLLSSAALLRALRVGTHLSWIVYAATLVVGIYSQLLFGLVAVGHGIYVAFNQRFRINRALTSYVLASCFGLLAFLPWLVVLCRYSVRGLGWTQDTQTFVSSAARWAGIVSRTFFDAGVSPADSFTLQMALIPVILPCLALIAYSMYFLIRTARSEVWMFVVVLTASVALPLLFRDLFWGQRCGTTRFILPSALGMQLAVAYLLSEKCFSFSPSIKRHTLWNLVLAIVVLSGTASCVLRSQRDIWWNKLPLKYGQYPRIARLIDRAEQPLVCLRDGWLPAQMLGHLLKGETRFQLVDKAADFEIADGFSDVFTLNQDGSTSSKLEKTYGAHAEQVDGILWRLQRNPLSGRAEYDKRDAPRGPLRPASWRRPN